MQSKILFRALLEISYRCHRILRTLSQRLPFARCGRLHIGCARHREPHERMMYENARGEEEATETLRPRRGPFKPITREREKERERGGEGRGRRARLTGMLHFHPELPLAHNHPPLRQSAKMTAAPEYPFTRGGTEEAIPRYTTRPPGYITSKPWHLAA